MLLFTVKIQNIDKVYDENTCTLNNDKMKPNIFHLQHNKLMENLDFFSLSLYLALILRQFYLLNHFHSYNSMIVC